MNTKTAYVVNGGLFNYRTDGSTNKYAVKCSHCGNVIPVGDGVKHAAYNGGFIHENCRVRLMGYHGDDEITRVGNPTKEGWEVSLELEAASYNTEVAEYMRKQGFSAERDCTVAIEWKNRIDCNMNGLAEVLSGLIAFDRLGYTTTERSNVGTHCNVSNTDVREFRWSNFGYQNFEKIAQASIDVLAENDHITACVFGRACGTWACDNAGEHSSAINTSHLTDSRKANTRFEFRIMKFHSGIAQGANRYIEAVQIWKRWTRTLMTAIKKGWTVDRIAEKCASYLRKEMAKQYVTLDDEWKEWVTR